MVLLLFYTGVGASVAAFEAFAASTALALMLLRYQKIRAYSMCVCGFSYVAALRYFSVYVQAHFTLCSFIHPKK